MEDERVSSGIIGLDSKIGNGFVKGSVNYVTGRTGTGKTLFCASFIYRGAINGERGVYVTTEEKEEEIKNDVKVALGYDLEELEKKGLIRFFSLIPILPTKPIKDEDVIELYIFDLTSKIESIVKELQAERLVIDSISVLEMLIKDNYMKRMALMYMINKLKELKVTTLISGTMAEDSKILSESGIIEFLVDSVIKLDLILVAEEFKRTLSIRKMRRTNHSTLVYPLEITRVEIKSKFYFDKSLYKFYES